MISANKPIFLIALSNDKKASLKLAKEERIIKECLSFAHDSGAIEYHVLPNASTDDIFISFNRFHNRIFLFHFAGHSGTDFLQLEDGLARSASLATLMGMQKNLKLVFLNGCANNAQVDALLNSGVKAVIATAEAVEDENSISLSSAFYGALSGGKNLRESFDTACARLKNAQIEFNIEHYRSLASRSSDNHHFNWGLFSKDERELEWILPSNHIEPVELQYSNIVLNNPEVNKQLVHLALDGMKTYADDDENKQFWQDYSENPEGIKFNHLQSKVLNAMPYILSRYIQDLFTPEGRRDGRLRLEKLSGVYQTLTRLLCAIAMASLWHELNRHKTGPTDRKFIIRAEYKADIKRFMALDAHMAQDFDYGRLIYTIACILKENDRQFFTPELQALADSIAGADEYYDAYRFLENQIRRGATGSEQAPDCEVEELCEEGERCLGLLLQKCAFLAYYQLITVRDIKVNNPYRIASASFVHNKTVMKGANPAVMDVEPLSLGEFKSDKTVMLSRNLEGKSPVLNLSPFLVDENTFKVQAREEDQPKIHFLDVFNEGQMYYYRHAINLELNEGFLLDTNYDRRKYRGLEILSRQIELFKTEIGL